MSDDIVGVYCQWKNSGEPDRASLTINNVQTHEVHCEERNDSNVSKWEGGPVFDSETAFTNVRWTHTVNEREKTVIEIRHTGPNDFNVVSQFKRIWNFSDNEVCLSSNEGIEGEYPYIEKDLGCYQIPDNAHAKAIEALLEK